MKSTGERERERNVDGATQEWKRSLRRRRIKMASQHVFLVNDASIHPSTISFIRALYLSEVKSSVELQRPACSLVRSDDFGIIRPLHLIFKHHHSEESARRPSRSSRHD